MSTPAETLNLRSQGRSDWRSLPDDLGLLAAAAGASVFTFFAVTPSEDDWRATLTGNHTVVWQAIILTALIVRWCRSRRGLWRDGKLVCALLLISVALNLSTARGCDPPRADTANDRLITFDMTK